MMRRDDLGRVPGYLRSEAEHILLGLLTQH